MSPTVQEDGSIAQSERSFNAKQRAFGLVRIGAAAIFHPDALRMRLPEHLASDAPSDAKTTEQMSLDLDD